MVSRPTAEVCAVVVTFCFDGQRLHRLLAALSLQVGQVILVDNHSPKASELTAFSAVYPNLRLVCLSENAGVAAAQNRGIRLAFDAGFKYVILFDQDSVPAADMVAILVGEYAALRLAHQRVAAVGPRLFDPRLGRNLPFYGYAGGRFVPRPEPATGVLVKTPILISSGLLIQRDVIDDVGYMDEGLFIDHVDHEWGFRAQAKQYELYGVTTAGLSHEIGGEIVLIHGVEFQKHASIRYYYMFRNSLLLYFRRYVPNAWKYADLCGRIDLLKLCLRELRPRRENLSMIVRGIAHG